MKILHLVISLEMGGLENMVCALAHLLTGVPVVHTKHGRNYPDMPRRVLLNRVLVWFTRIIVAVPGDVAGVGKDAGTEESAQGGGAEWGWRKTEKLVGSAVRMAT